MFLPLGSLLSSVLAYIYIEFLESGPFKYIPSYASCFRYIDDILLIYPQGPNINRITDRLINVEPSITFKYELESYNTLPFWNVL